MNTLFEIHPDDKNHTSRIRDQYENLRLMGLLPVPYVNWSDDEIAEIEKSIAKKGEQRHINAKGPLGGIEWKRKMIDIDEPKAYSIDMFKQKNRKALYSYLNIGVICDNIICLDFDKAKEGKNEVCGVWLMRHMIHEGILNPKTMCHEKSKSGGYHWYFKTPIMMDDIKTGDKCLTIRDDETGYRYNIAVDVKYKQPVKCYPSVGYESGVNFSKESIMEMPHKLETILRYGGFDAIKQDDGGFCLQMTSDPIKPEKPIKFTKRVVEDLNLDDIDTVFLSMILDNITPDKYQNYGDWVKIGLALFGSFSDTEHSELALDYWDHYSEKYGLASYTKGCCQEKWLQFKHKDGGLTLGTLIHWAKEGNPNLFTNYWIKKTRYEARYMEELGGLHDADGNPMQNCVFDDVFSMYCDIESEPVTEGTILGFLKQTIAYDMRGIEYYIVSHETDYVTNAEGNEDEVTNYNYLVINDKQLQEKTKGFTIKRVEGDSFVFVKLYDLILKFRNDLSYYRVRFFPYTRPCDDKTKKNIQRRELNIFKGFKMAYDPDFVVDESKIKWILHHQKEWWCAGDDGELSWIDQFIAHKLQKPWVKMEVVPHFYSNVQGNGKNIIWDMITRKIFGVAYAPTVGSLDQITGNFNEILEMSPLIVCDEVSSLTSARHDTDKLKSIITGSHIPINRKHKSIKVPENYTTIVMLGNHDPIPGRRIVGIHVREEKPEYMPQLIAECTSDETAKHYFHYMMRKDVSKFNYRDVPLTRFQNELSLLKVDNPVMCLVDLINDNNQTIIFNGKFEVTSKDLYKEYCKWCGEKNETILKEKNVSSILVSILGAPSTTKIIRTTKVKGYKLTLEEVKKSITKRVNNGLTSGDKLIDPFKDHVDETDQQKLEALVNLSNDIADLIAKYRTKLGINIPDMPAKSEFDLPTEPEDNILVPDNGEIDEFDDL